MSDNAIRDWIAPIVAIAALVLSQLPPLLSLIGSPNLALKETDRITITHVLGSLVITSHTTIENLGRRVGSIDRVVVTIRDSANNTRELTGDLHYIESSAVPLTTITVPSRDAWRAYILFAEPIHSLDRARGEALRQNLRFLGVSNQNNHNIYEELSSDAIRKLAALRAGDHTMRVMTYVDDVSDPVAEKCYSFSISQFVATHLGRMPPQLRVEGDGTNFRLQIMEVKKTEGFTVDLQPTTCGR